MKRVYETMATSNDKIKDVSKYWGKQMPMRAMEEAGELIQAISKVERTRYLIEDMESDLPMENLIEEIGDTFISLMALMHTYRIDEQEVTERIQTKLNVKY